MDYDSDWLDIVSFMRSGNTPRESLKDSDCTRFMDSSSLLPQSRPADAADPPPCRPLFDSRASLASAAHGSTPSTQRVAIPGWRVSDSLTSDESEDDWDSEPDSEDDNADPSGSITSDEPPRILYRPIGPLQPKEDALEMASSLIIRSSNATAPVNEDQRHRVGSVSYMNPNSSHNGNSRRMRPSVNPKTCAPSVTLGGVIPRPMVLRWLTTTAPLDESNETSDQQQEEWSMIQLQDAYA